VCEEIKRQEAKTKNRKQRTILHYKSIIIAIKFIETHLTWLFYLEAFRIRWNKIWLHKNFDTKSFKT